MAGMYDDGFRDREHAGRELARMLARFKGASPLVLGLPRGGLPVAREVAEALDGDLDAWLVRKIGAPYQPELALGALAEEGEPVIDWARAELVGASREEVEQIVASERGELDRRRQRYRHGRPTPDVRDRVVIVVDDGIATGSTVEAAAVSLRAHAPAKLVLAVPVAPVESLERLASFYDEVVCALPATMMFAISLFYDDFRQVSDEEAVAILSRGRSDGAAEHARL